MSVDEIREYLNVDSLSYLTLDRLLTATGAVGAGFCDACLTGSYPVPIPESLSKDVLELPSDKPVHVSGFASLLDVDAGHPAQSPLDLMNTEESLDGN
jgi:amidophosphoribosyltransferase